MLGVRGGHRDGARRRVMVLRQTRSFGDGCCWDWDTNDDDDDREATGDGTNRDDNGAPHDNGDDDYGNDGSG